MIPIERLKRIKKVICHDACPDGTASAILVHDVLPDAEIVFCQYGTKAWHEMPATEGMLFADFSPYPERALEFARAGVIVLDHHKHAQGLVENLSVMGKDAIGIFADETNEPGVSGAVLAYRHLWDPLRKYRDDLARLRAGQFASLAGVRDTWQRKDAQWDEACAQAEALVFWPVEGLMVGDPFGVNHDVFLNRLYIGSVLVEKKKEVVKRALERAWRTTTPKGTRLIVFEGVTLSSDAAEVVGDGADVVAAFEYGFDGGEHTLRLSTRSHAGYDVGALAKHYRGSGHTAAAGFTVRFGYDDWEAEGPAGMATQHPYAAVRDLVVAYEEK
jgi:hypothetical protein